MGRTSLHFTVLAAICAIDTTVIGKISTSSPTLTRLNNNGRGEKILLLNSVKGGRVNNKNIKMTKESLLKGITIIRGGGEDIPTAAPLTKWARALKHESKERLIDGSPSKPKLYANAQDSYEEKIYKDDSDFQFLEKYSQTDDADDDNDEDDDNVMMKRHMIQNASSIDDEKTVYDVIIVGSGWAGIATAINLEAKGINNYKILEARKNIGGRSFTLKHMQWEGEKIPVDLGSMWLLSGKLNRIYNAKLFRNIKSVRSTDTERLYKPNNGGPLSRAELTEIYNSLYEKGFDKYQERKQMNTNQDESLNISLNEFLSTIQTKNRLKIGVSLQKATVTYLIKKFTEFDYAGNLERLSLWWWNNDDWAGGAAGENADDLFLNGGYSSLFRAYAKPVRKNIDNESVVKRIDYRENIINVYFSDTAKKVNKMFKAKKVVITVPLGVLKARDIRFQPQLPKSKRQAIDRIGMGRLNKIFMFWKESDVFWDDLGNIESFADVVERENDFSFYNPRALKAGKNHLFAFFDGDEAQKLEDKFALTDKKKYESEITKRAMVPLRNMFRNDIPDPEEVIVTRWGADRFSKGSYSYNKVGMKKTDRNILRAPIKNRVYFAGEATSHQYFASTHGAYLTGRVAASKISESLKRSAQQKEK